MTAEMDSESVGVATFTAALNSVSFAISVWDENFRLVFYNRAYLDFFFEGKDVLRLGMHLNETSHIFVQNGIFKTRDAKSVATEMAANFEQCARSQEMMELLRESSRGTMRSRILAMPGGGWVNTHDDITEELRRAEENRDYQQDLERQNMLFTTAIKRMSQGLSLYDANRRLIICNERYAQIYGLPETLTQPGTLLWDIMDHCAQNGMVSVADAAERREYHSQRLDAKVEGDSVEEMLNGKVVTISHQPLPDGGWLAVHEDITEQRQKEALIQQRTAEVERQNMRFGAAVNSMLHGISMFDKDQRLVTCNQSYIDHYKLPKHLTQVGTSYWDIYRHQTSGALGFRDYPAPEVIRKRIESQKFHSGYLEKEDGRILSISHQPLSDGGWLAVHEDITERRQKEELINRRTAEVERQNMRFVAAVNNMPHGMVVFDSERRLVICNEPYIEFYDLPKHLSAVGANFSDIFEYRLTRGMVSAADAENPQVVLDREWKPTDKRTMIAEFINGRVVHMNHQTMADGGRISIHQDITEQYRSQEMIEHLAHHDSLTGLPNRISFLAAMAKAEKKIALGEKMAVLCIDLDNFKPINDNMGHAIGDAVLKITGKRIAAIVGEHGMAARLGGDEFAAILGPVTDSEQVAEIAQDIVVALCEPLNADGLEISVSASIGVAIGPQHGTTTEALMVNGDLALYRSKSENQGNYCFFDTALSQKHIRRRAIESGLKNALLHGRLELHYQPLLNLENNDVHCCEALMRWEDPVLGAISPAEFIPIAEDTGLIRKMGEWALQRACQTAANWPEHVRIAVNVSPVQFKGDDLVERVSSALKEAGLAANRLELEITESLFLADNDHNLSILHALRDLGVRIALDDFGTGYSSLSYLRSFPFDKIKIDRTFISDLSSNKKETAAIITAVLQLGTDFGMATVAEGVETEGQLDFVRAQGCTEVQGFLFSPPLPARAIDAFLMSNTGTRTQRNKVGS